MKNNDKIEVVLEFLKDQEWHTTTEISAKTDIHFYKIESILLELLNEDKLEKDIKPNQTFWRLK